MSNLLDLESNLSHAQRSHSFEDGINALKQKILDRGDLPHVTCQRQLEIIDGFCEFPLGRFILDRRGANGFWTDYMISHPQKGKISGLNIENKPLNNMEHFLLNQSPIVLAHQERFQIFQRLLQSFIKEHVVLASVPCGLMRDLITLDFSTVSDYKLIGVDIDEESILLAQELADQKGITNISFMQEDAWKLSLNQEVDVITSSGLNVYEPDETKVFALYRKFFEALKPGGHLIISVLTYPPGEAKKSEWDMSGFTEEVLLLDRIFHKDILDVKWRNFRQTSELDKEFKEVGFSEISIHFDKHHIFPTILAKKPE